jgi:hypothetical protein
MKRSVTTWVVTSAPELSGEVEHVWTWSSFFFPTKLLWCACLSIHKIKLLLQGRSIAFFFFWRGRSIAMLLLSISKRKKKRSLLPEIRVDGQIGVYNGKNSQPAWDQARDVCLQSTVGKILNQLEIKPEMPVFYGICVLLPILCMEIESKTHVISVPSS